MKIKNMIIENFRGIGNCNIDFKFSDSNIVIIYGPNGFGKTSIVDAVEWGLTGKIDHLEQLGEIDKKRFNTCQMINFYDSIKKEQKSAKIVIDFDDGSIVKRQNRVTDKGDFSEGYTNNFDERIFLEDIKSDIKFNKYFHSSHMLGQDTINSFLCSEKSKERANILFEILGMNQYLDIENKIKNDIINIKTFTSNRKNFLKDKGEIERKIDNIKNDINRKLKDNTYDTYEDIINRISLCVDKVNRIIKNTAKIQDIIDSVFVEEINNSNNNEIKKYSLLIKEVEIIKELLDKYLKLTNKLSYTRKIKEQKHEINELYEYINLYNKSEYIKIHLNDVNFDIINRKYIKVYEKAQGRVNKINLKYKERKNRKLILLDDIKEFIKLPIECEEELNKVLKELVELYSQDDNIIKDIDILKKESQEYINLLKKYSNCKVKKEQLESQKLELSSLNDEVKNFYSLNKEYVKLHKDDINTTCICPLCETVLTDKTDSPAEYILGKINKALEINNASYKNMSILLKNADEELISIKNILKKNKVIINDILNRIFNLVNVTIIKTDEKFLKINEKIKDNLISEREKIKIENDKLNRVKQYLKDFNIESTELNILNLTNNIRNKLNLAYMKVKSYDIIDYTLDELIRDTSKVNIIKNNFDNIDEYKENTIEDIIFMIEENNKIINIIKLIYEEIETMKSEIPRVLLDDFSTIIKLQEKKARLDNDISKLDIIYRKLDGINGTFSEFKTNMINKYVVDNLLVHQIYSNINPHPIFNNITIDNSDGIIFTINNENRLQADYLFSSAQKNVLALSIFLGFALQQNWSKLDHIFIDDPIQNMDDINVVAFIDIIRSLFNEDSKFKDKTIVLTTHDEDFRNLLRMKCRNIKIREYELVSYDQNGPKIIERKNF